MPVTLTGGARKAYVTAIKLEELNAKIFEFRRRLQNPGSDPLPLAQELYRIVFPETLRQDLDVIHAKTIMWSVDGALRYIPMAALHDGHEYLVTQFRNLLITPISLDRLKDVPQARWQGEGFGVSEALAGFPALGGVPVELAAIFGKEKGSAGPAPGTVRLNAAFTKATFLADLNGRKNVIHVATHFDSRPGVAANSRLLLGDGTTWDLQDIASQAGMFRGVDLLTLSACNTAFAGSAGDDGREVDSFGAIAQQFGAKGVIASLWSVSDEASARLMQTMYSLRQENPQIGKSEALRQAQERMVSGALRRESDRATDRGVKIAAPAGAAHDWTHPYYWAPFILIGNWQ